MYQFESLTELGLAAATMSGVEDGDCSYDDPTNRARFLERAGAFHEGCVGLRQVHGTDVLTVDDDSLGRGGIDRETALVGDGLVTNTSGLSLLIGAADCVPVVLYSPESNVLCGLHAGRAGTYGNISGGGVRAMVERFAVDPATIHALIGPSICVDHYEVSEELAEQFRAKGLPTEGRRLDLWEANRQQLLKVGVQEERIEVSGVCTFGSSDFYSFRRDGDRKRNLVVVGM